MTSKPTYEELESRVKALETELAESKRQDGPVTLMEQHLKAILDNTNLPVYLKDAELNYILVNREFERLALVSNDQIRGKNDFAVFPQPIADLFREQDEKVKKRNTLVEFTETLELADGVHTFLTAKFPLHDAQGNIYAIGGVCTDITSLKKTENELLENEERYRSFIDHFHGIAYRGNIRTFIPIYFHGAVKDITGYTEEEFTSGNPRWDQIVHPEDLPLLIGAGEKMLTVPGYSFRREYRIIRKDGEIRWIFERGQTICAKDSEPPEWIQGTLFDITGRKGMENALRESEEKYRTLVETASLGIQISDRQGRIIFSNPAHHKIHGLSPGEIVGKYIWDFIDNEEGKSNLQKYYHYIFDQQPPPSPYVTTNKTPDGQDIAVQIDWNYMRNAEGEVSAICSIIDDITARIAAENALKASESKFRSVIEACPEGIMIFKLETDGSLIFIDSNPAADKILGLDCQQLLGKKIEDAFPSLIRSETPELFRQICLSGRPWQMEQFSYEDSHIKGVFEVHAFQTEPGKMALFFQDITAKRHMEEELNKIQKLESVGILAGGIAHDFNNLLTAILGNISMAKLFAQTDLDKVFERLTDAEKASLRARDLTQQLLTFSKGGAPVKCAASIPELVKDSTSFMLSGSNVNSIFDLPHDLWPVDIDIGQISQVIQNVVKNADQAMPEGGTITIRAENMTVEEDLSGLPLRSGRYVHLSLADQGVGIPQKHLARIFDPYFSTKQEGSGLGLAASYSIIKNHDGLITAESEYGIGTTFHIYLPVSLQEPEVKTMSRKKSLHSGERVLIMDDDEDVLNVAVNMLNLMGYKTETVGDGAEAVAVYNKALQEGQPYDGVLLDLTIPGGMGGLETVRQLSIIDPEVKAVVSSGYANDPILANYTQYGFKAVVTKPYDMEHLGHVLRELFD